MASLFSSLSLSLSLSLSPPSYLRPLSKLVQEGLNHHEISERVKEKAMNESESIYGTLYGTLEEGQEEE